MTTLRTTLFSGVLALVALPASAQILAEDLWKSWESLSRDMGYELATGALKRQGDQLIATDVKLNMASDELTVSNRIPEVILREVNGSVEVTTSPEWHSETVVKMDDKSQTVVTSFSQTGYLLTVSGSVAAPAYAMKADSLSFTQKLPIAEAASGKAEGTVNTSGTLTAMTGGFTLGTAEPREMTYTMAADSLRVVVKSDATDAATQGNFTFDAEKIASDFRGTLPPAMDPETDLTKLLKMGLHGQSNNSSGPVSLSVNVTSPDMPFKGDLRFAATRSNFGLTDNEIRLDLDLNGVDSGPATETPSASDVILRAAAFLNQQATSDEEILKSGKLNLTITESQPLLDRLSKAGLIPEDQLMGIQMMLAMFSKPGDKPGSITSTVEVTETGDFLVNGQSMQ